MATTVVINGLNYSIPAVGDTNWGQNVTDALVALSTAASASAGFLTRVTVTSTPITVVSGRTYLVDTTVARTLNLPAPANNAYLLVKDVTGTSKTNNITIHRFAAEKINGTAADFVCSNNSALWLFVSDGTDWFLLKDPDITPYAQLNLTGSVLNADLAGSIAMSKLTGVLPVANGGTNSGTTLFNNRIMYSSAGTVIELSALNANVAMATDANGLPNNSLTTATELGYLHFVTSAIQTQLNAKLVSPLTADLALGAFRLTGLASGSAASPAIAFSAATTTGLALISSTPCIIAGGTTIAQFTPANGPFVLGTVSGDAAGAGNIGEYVETVFSNVASGASGVVTDSGSISLTAGDWDISFNVMASANVAGTNTSWVQGISVTAGNSVTGLVVGSNYMASLPAFPSASNQGSTITAWRKNLTVTTTVYAKTQIVFSSGTWAFYGRLSARRVR